MRCRSVHDLAAKPYRILRCSLKAGHPGFCRPKAWEPITAAEYKAFSKRVKRSA